MGANVYLLRFQQWLQGPRWSDGWCRCLLYLGTRVRTLQDLISKHSTLPRSPALFATFDWHKASRTIPRHKATFMIHWHEA